MWTPSRRHQRWRRGDVPRNFHSMTVDSPTDSIMGVLPESSYILKDPSGAAVWIHVRKRKARRWSLDCTALLCRKGTNSSDCPEDSHVVSDGQGWGVDFEANGTGPPKADALVSVSNRQCRPGTWTCIPTGLEDLWLVTRRHSRDWGCT